jgi:type I restriction enzyme R subunit
VAQFNETLERLRAITPTPESVNDLTDENADKEFVQAFRQVLRLRNVIMSFADFDYAHIDIDEQTLENYKGKYLDVYDKVKSDHEKEKVSILDDIDFELELTRRDEVNVSYILRLIASMVGADEEKQVSLKKTISDTMANTAELRNKRELIERFIESTLPNIAESSDVEGEFAEFISEEQVKEFKQLCKEEGLDSEKTQAILDHYVSTGRIPLEHELAEVMISQPSILRRETVLAQIKGRIVKFIDTFIENV